MTIMAVMKSLMDRGIPSLYVKSFDAIHGNHVTSAVKEIFRTVRQASPCLVVFEDLDSLVNEDNRSYFLNEVDGIKHRNGTLMIASANNLDRLDPAIAKRPSRFDRIYHFKLPGPKERKAYVDRWMDNQDHVDIGDDVRDSMGHLLEGYTFAYMKEALLEWEFKGLRDLKEKIPETSLEEEETASCPCRRPYRKKDIPDSLVDNVDVKRFLSVVASLNKQRNDKPPAVVNEKNDGKASKKVHICP